MSCFGFAPPPVHALKAVRKLQVSRGKGALVIPEWYSSPVWAILQLQNMKPFIVNKWIFPGKNFITCNDKKSIFSNFRGNLVVFFLDFSSYSLS